MERKTRNERKDETNAKTTGTKQPIFLIQSIKVIQQLVYLVEINVCHVEMIAENEFKLNKWFMT